MEISIDSIDDICMVSPSEYNTNQINMIKDKYPELRQKAKAPVFA